MAKTWYPVINYLTCIECGSCVSKCTHGVYDTEKAPAPVVINPVFCVDHCHGCGNRCPVGAITYVGDDTGWVPPNGAQTAGIQTDEAACCSGQCETVEISCCSGQCEAVNDNKIIVEYLYLDLQTCERCIGTDKVLDEVMLTLTPAIKLAGFEVRYEKIEIDTAELAKQYRFISSPTIRVNGQDICQSVSENSCGCCSDISGTDVDCRVFEYNGETYEVPPKGMLAEAILRSLFGQAEAGCSCEGYELPENLRKFFEGKGNKDKENKGCDCGGKCC